MTIAVIAASGRTGTVFVRCALQAGHKVRAGVHGSHSLTPHKNLAIVQCDATNPYDVKRLLKGSDAIASFIGHTKNSPRYVQSNAIRTVIDVAKAVGITRIISLTGTGVRQQGDTITMIDKVLNTAIMLIDPARVRDGIQHANILKASSTEWTIIRVLKLQNTPPKAYTLSAKGPTKPYVSRQDVARAALEVIEQHSFIREMPIISPKR